MSGCWAYEPSKRPNFQQLKQALAEIKEEERAQVTQVTQVQDIRLRDIKRIHSAPGEASSTLGQSMEQVKLITP